MERREISENQMRLNLVASIIQDWSVENFGNDKRSEPQDDYLHDRKSANLRKRVIESWLANGETHTRFVAPNGSLYTEIRKQDGSLKRLTMDMESLISYESQKQSVQVLIF